MFVKNSWNFHGSWFLTFGISTSKGQVFHSVREVRESRGFVRGLEKFRQIKIFLEKFGKGRRNFYPWKSLTSREKPYGQRTVCDCIWQSVVSMMLLFASATLLRWFNISNPFYFNLSEVVLHLDQERNLHAINFFVSLLMHSLVV